jgi:hypothetical protein
MRKQILNTSTEKTSSGGQVWLDVENLAQVELSSEDAAHPIEAALLPGEGSGWRAAQAGEQTIRLMFDEARRIRRIQLLFQEHQQARTQEFVLRWSPDGGQSWRDIVRQQYNFSPPGMAREFEDYTVDIDGVKLLELKIVPNISGGDAKASIAQFLIA